MAKGDKPAAIVADQGAVSEQPASKKTERRFVIYGKVIDKLNIRRTRRELTPAVCPHCGWDACEAAKVPPYADLPAELQLKVVSLVEEHKQKVHDKSESKVLRESEMPTEYLGFDS